MIPHWMLLCSLNAQDTGLQPSQFPATTSTSVRLNQYTNMWTSSIVTPSAVYFCRVPLNAETRIQLCSLRCSLLHKPQSLHWMQVTSTMTADGQWDFWPSLVCCYKGVGLLENSGQILATKVKAAFRVQHFYTVDIVISDFVQAEPLCFRRDPVRYWDSSIQCTLYVSTLSWHDICTIISKPNAYRCMLFPPSQCRCGGKQWILAS